MHLFLINFHAWVLIAKQQKRTMQHGSFQSGMVHGQTFSTLKAFQSSKSDIVLIWTPWSQRNMLSPCLSHRRPFHFSRCRQPATYVHPILFNAGEACRLSVRSNYLIRSDSLNAAVLPFRFLKMAHVIIRLGWFGVAHVGMSNEQQSAVGLKPQSFARLNKSSITCHPALI